jgi:ethanolamine utilization protein EutP (predicted NTPase)
MKNMVKCRRTFVSLFGIVALTVLGIVTKQDVAASIAAIAMTISGANAAQAVFALRGVKPAEAPKDSK